MQITIDINRNHLRAALVCAAEQDIRYYLRGVLVSIRDDAHFVVGCDGSRLAVFKGEGGTTPVEFIIPHNLVKAVKQFKAMPNITIEFDTETENVTVRDIDGVHTARAVEGRFPNWRRVIPATVDGVAAQFNAEFLGDLPKLAKLAGSKPGNVRIHHNGLGAALVSIVDMPEFVGVLMPYRDKTPPPVPSAARFA